MGGVDGRADSVVISSDSVVMLLLGSADRGSSSLLRVLMVALLVHPWLFTLWVILMLVREDVCPREHLDRGGTASKRGGLRTSNALAGFVSGLLFQGDLIAVWTIKLSESWDMK